MTFAVMGLGTVFNALANRRDPASGLESPILKALAISLVPVTMVVLATELPGLQRGLLTTSLTGKEWLACFGLAALLPLVIETGKWIRRRRAPRTTLLDTQRAVTPERALATAAGRAPGSAGVVASGAPHEPAPAQSTSIASPNE
jgi:Ca2+-transporting ATPase